ncbi:MAG: tRNA (adenosine(37)-N6)-dimethylallyltransferase MiaA [Candidatus Paceibacterota bacterium]|jgi:tRNA dimethylallyltransferase
MTKKSKTFIVLGPTACGKSDLAVEIALTQNGEVISADSRQVYERLNIGTGKITKKEMRGVKHHLLDVADPKKTFVVTDFQKLGEQALQDILSRGKLPIICGGTGLYIQALTDVNNIPEVPPNKKLRTQLEKKSTSELFSKLQKIDPVRALTIDKHNPRRLIRAIEIAAALGSVPVTKPEVRKDIKFLKIGLLPSDELIKERIYNRLLTRLDQGMLTEAKKLHTRGLSWKRMEDLGLEYRYMSRHLTGKISKQKMIDQLAIEIWHYAKRQKTWFKRDKQIHWFESKDDKKILKLVKSFLKK